MFWIIENSNHSSCTDRNKNNAHLAANLNYVWGQPFLNIVVSCLLKHMSTCIPDMYLGQCHDHTCRQSHQSPFRNCFCRNKWEESKTNTIAPCYDTCACEAGVVAHTHGRKHAWGRTCVLEAPQNSLKLLARRFAVGIPNIMVQLAL